MQSRAFTQHEPTSFDTLRRGPLAPQRGRRGRAWLFFAGVGLTCVLQACYSFAPVTGLPSADTYLVLDINDRGRVELGEAIGPSASSVAGRLVFVDDTLYQLSVAQVTYANRQSNQWSGERVSIRRELVSRARERRFSRGRTALAAGSAIVAIGLLIANTDLIRGGTPEREPPVVPPDPD